MQRYKEKEDRSKRLFVGIDLHILRWHVTIRMEEEELFSGGVPGNWESLRRLLERHKGYEIHAVYEAGYFGFWPTIVWRNVVFVAL